MKTGKVTAEWILFRLFAGFLRLLPRRMILRLGRGIGGLVFRLDKKHARLARTNLTFAMGNKYSSSQIDSLARGAFRHFGAAFLDILYLSRLRPEKRNRLIIIEGEDIIREALKGGRGALLFSAHFGLWEMAPTLVSRLGKLHVVARPLDNPKLEDFLLKLRRRLGAEVIYKLDAARPILRSLRNNDMVAILIDQNVLRKEAVFVDFFSKPAATTPALATFHLRTQSPLIPVFCTPTSEGHYRIRVLPPPKIQITGDSQQDIQQITQVCTRVIEDQIRKDPEFWFWFHNRWKSRPQSEIRP